MASKSYAAADQKTRDLAAKVDFNVELVATMTVHYVASVVKTYEKMTVAEVRAANPPEWYGNHIKLVSHNREKNLKAKAVWDSTYVAIPLLVITANSGDQKAIKAVQELGSGVFHLLLGVTGPFGAGFMLAEALVGKDAVTGKQMSAGERVLSAVPALSYGVSYGAKALQLSKLSRAAKPLDEVADATKVADLVDDVGDMTRVKVSSPPLETPRFQFVDEILTKPESIWGKSVDEIATEFENAGFKVKIEQSTKGSKKSVQLRIEGHPEITNIQVHPGGGRHDGSYYKISTSTNGKIKVVDSKTYVPTPGEIVKIVEVDKLPKVDDPVASAQIEEVQVKAVENPVANAGPEPTKKPSSGQATTAGVGVKRSSSEQQPQKK